MNERADCLCRPLVLHLISAKGAHITTHRMADGGNSPDRYNGRLPFITNCLLRAERSLVTGT
jgi:hypothetical protein